MYFSFWRAEKNKPNITAAVPKFLLPAILAILLLLPLLAFLSFPMPFVRPLLGFLIWITFWGILLLAVIGVPFVAFRGDFSNRQKVVVVLAALVYLVSATTGPFFKFARDWGWEIAGVWRFVDIVSLSLYCIFAVLLFAPRATEKARIAFVTFCAGLILFLQGLHTPIEFGRFAKSYEVVSVFGDSSISLFPVKIGQANILVIAGIVILGLLFWLTRAPVPAAKAD